MPASEACVVRFGPEMDPFREFGDLNMHSFGDLTDTVGQVQGPLVHSTLK